MDFLGTPIGYLMDFIYRLVSNYGFTIIILTLLFKLILLPLTIKQQKSTKAMQAIQPAMAEIQKKYANEKDRQSQEIMKLYKEYNVNPMAGCLPTLIQFPILIGLYGAIAKPLKFMLHLTAEQITNICKIVGVNAGGADYYYQIKAAQLASSPEYISEVTKAVSGFRGLDFSFIGINLAATPRIGFIDFLWIFPILAAVLTYVSSKIMQTPAANADQSANSTMKFMNYFFPVMILYLGFRVPTGLSLYWVVNSLLQIAQFYCIDRNFKVALEESVNSDMEEKKKLRKKKKK